ncbi:hypothetical protein DIPPA_27895 [Diplonema papillatum]|nr:hypothetical protein DIPPA_27895 [Diplonema papillatum]
MHRHRSSRSKRSGKEFYEEEYGKLRCLITGGCGGVGGASSPPTADLLTPVGRGRDGVEESQGDDPARRLAGEECGDAKEKVGHLGSSNFGGSTEAAGAPCPREATQHLRAFDLTRKVATKDLSDLERWQYQALGRRSRDPWDPASGPGGCSAYAAKLAALSDKERLRVSPERLLGLRALLDTEGGLDGCALALLSGFVRRHDRDGCLQPFEGLES